MTKKLSSKNISLMKVLVAKMTLKVTQGYELLPYETGNNHE